MPKNRDGSVTRRSGVGFTPKGSATRGFTPPGAKSARGNAVVPVTDKKRVAGRSAYDVER